MKKAVDEVEKCRRTLQWTYAMAYYLEKGNEKELFEDNQRCANFNGIGRKSILHISISFQRLGESRGGFIRAARVPDRS